MINTNDSGVLQHNHLRQQEREGARRHVIQRRLVFFWDKPRGETQNKKQKQKTKKNNLCNRFGAAASPLPPEWHLFRSSLHEG